MIGRIIRTEKSGWNSQKNPFLRCFVLLCYMWNFERENHTITVLPSRELTYPPDFLAYLKMIFRTSPGGICDRFLEGSNC